MLVLRKALGILLLVTFAQGHAQLFPGSYGGCATASVTRPSCAPGCDAVITLTLPAFSCYSAVTTPTSYNVIVISSTPCVVIPNMIDVTPGVYTFTGICRDCDYSFSVFNEDFSMNLDDMAPTVDEHTLQVSPGTSLSISCNAACNGSLNLFSTGGTTPINYTIFPPSSPSVTLTRTNTSLPLTGLCAGTLVVLARDAKNCTYQAPFTFTFTEPPTLLSNIVTTNVACKGASTGAFQIRPSGGTGPYTVNLVPGGTFTANSTTTITLNNRPAGVINSTVTDSRGCTRINSTTITEPAVALSVAGSQTNITCFGACTGIGDATVTGGGTSYTFTWLPGPGSNSVNSTLCAGMNTVQWDPLESTCRHASLSIL